MARFAEVFVENGKYRINGDFHEMTQNMPIRNMDAEGRLIGVTNPRDMTYIHSYGGEAPFFEGLSKGKLLGTRCDNPACKYKGTQYIPFRIHCPDCLARMTVVDFTKQSKESGRIHTFMVCERSGAFNALDKPIKFINIEFDGISTILMSTLSVGEPKFGMQVVPIFKTIDPTYTILDLSWVPKGTKAAALPRGFTF